MYEVVMWDFMSSKCYHVLDISRVFFLNFLLHRRLRIGGNGYIKNEAQKRLNNQRRSLPAVSSEGRRNAAGGMISRTAISETGEFCVGLCGCHSSECGEYRLLGCDTTKSSRARLQA